MIDFNHGPFSFESGERITLAGEQSQRWSMRYGRESLAEHVLPTAHSRSDIIEAFADDRSAFVRRAREEAMPERVDLIDQTTGDAISHVFLRPGAEAGMTPGLIDDRSQYWLRSENRLYSKPITLAQYGLLSADAATPTQWIAHMLPSDVLAIDPSDWRAPTSWEIRHVVGEGSFTGMSGARAAELVGVTPQNFRKYTAADGASTRQNMSYAIWHLLLHKLGVQRA